MNVHLVRSKELSVLKFNRVIDYLNLTKGDISFKGIYEEPLSEEEQEQEEELSDRIKMTLEDNTPRNKEDMTPFFEKCEDYRKQHKIPNQELVILLTDQKNSSNFLGYVSDDMKNVFIQTSNWKYVLGEGYDDVLPICYEIAAWTLRSLIFNREGEMKSRILPKPIGCVMDMCTDVRDFKFKIRTGDIREDVLEIIYQKSISPAIINQLISLFEKIRLGVLFRQRSTISLTPTRMELIDTGKKLYIKFLDLGDELLKLEPIELCIYCLFLKVENGIILKNMGDYRDEFEEIVHSIYIKSDDAKIDALVEKYTSVFKDGLVNQNINRINTKLTLQLPQPILDQYLIQGNRKDEYGIKLDRTLVNFGSIFPKHK